MARTSCGGELPARARGTARSSRASTGPARRPCWGTWRLRQDLATVPDHAQGRSPAGALAYGLGHAVAFTSMPDALAAPGPVARLRRSSGASSCAGAARSKSQALYPRVERRGEQARYPWRRWTSRANAMNGLNLQARVAYPMAAARSTLAQTAAGATRRRATPTHGLVRDLAGGAGPGGFRTEETLGFSLRTRRTCDTQPNPACSRTWRTRWRRNADGARAGLSAAGRHARRR